MRPLRLMFDGFGSYREHTEVDLSDVDFFVLTGPTGSGKSTVIDALCFALYGTVPRWGKGDPQRAWRPRPPSAGCAWSSRRRAVGTSRPGSSSGDAKGEVRTKEVRLDRLDDTVPVDADLTKLLEATVEAVAEGPDAVTAEVTALLGIGYEHFTQCVLLPQGRFAEFLHAKPGERQDLLIELLAYGVYEEIGQRARERGKAAASKLEVTRRRLAELGEVTAEGVAAAADRVAELTALQSGVESAVAEMADLRTRWTEAHEHTEQARGQVTALAGLAMPADVAELADRLAAADALIAERAAELTRSEKAEAAAEQACADLPEPTVLQRWHEAYGRDTRLRTELTDRRAHSERAERAEAALTEEVAAADQALTAAEADRAAAERAHRAAALVADLRPGEPCPVCLRDVHTVPQHELPADLDRTGTAVEQARTAASGLRVTLVRAGKDAVAARSAVDTVERQLHEVAAVLADAPPAEEVERTRRRRTSADAELDQARAAARAARAQHKSAVDGRESLQHTEQRAWAALRASRDGFVALDAPAVDGADLALAWRTLLDWAETQRTVLGARVEGSAAEENSLRERGTAAAAALVELLGGHGVAVQDAARAPIALAEHRAGAERDVTDLRATLDNARALAKEIDQQQEEAEVADLLGNLLRSNQFERWLCTEALDSLVLEASHTLMQLSSGQFELHRGDRNELVVVDHNDAGTHRPVNTLSGGETFQASLALALALSRQVVGLSGGKRDLNSMFLDEGFGTLDESTLDTVAVTLERLAQETDRMVGIVTHVPALAERVPVQFAVTRDGASSRLRRVGM